MNARFLFRQMQECFIFKIIGTLSFFVFFCILVSVVYLHLISVNIYCNEFTHVTSTNPK